MEEKKTPESIALFFVVGRVLGERELVFINTGKLPSKASDICRAEFHEILRERNKPDAYPNERVQKQGELGLWYTYCDHNMICFSMVVPQSSQLTSTKAYSYLSSISTQAYHKFPELAKNPQDTQSLTHRKSMVIDLLVDSGVYTMNGDLLSSTHHKLGKATETMRDNLQKVIANTADLDEMESSSEDIRIASASFRTKSRQLERQMCLRKWKIYGVLALFISAVLLYFFLGMFYGSDTDSDKK